MIGFSWDGCTVSEEDFSIDVSLVVSTGRAGYENIDHEAKVLPGRDDVDLERGRGIVVVVVVVVGSQERLMGAKLAARVLCMLEVHSPRVQQTR